MKNVKLLFLVLLIAGLSANSYAGDKIGIRAGWQYSNIYGGASIGKNLSSLYVGVFKEKAIIPLFKLGSGLEYGQTGTRWNSNYSVQLHQISIPIYAKLKLGPICVLAGAAPSVKVSETWKVEDANLGIEDDFDAKIFDTPLFAGLRYDILLLHIEARYYMGSFNVSGNANNEGYKSQFFQLGIALTI